MNGIKYSWYKVKVPTKQWNEFYSKTGGYTFLSGDKSETFMGFLAVIPPDGCLEITDYDELKKIDSHRRAINRSPYVLQDYDPKTNHN